MNGLPTLPYPYAEECADRLVVAGLQLHVAAVVELLDPVPPPQNAVAPGRHTALPTAETQRGTPPLRTLLQHAPAETGSSAAVNHTHPQPG